MSSERSRPNGGVRGSARYSANTCAQGSNVVWQDSAGSRQQLLGIDGAAAGMSSAATHPRAHGGDAVQRAHVV